RVVVNSLRKERPPFLVPAATLCEAAYLIGTRLGRGALDGVLGDLEAGRYQLDCGEADLPRVRELIERYEDLPLGFANASVIACAERNGGRVLTLDTRDFGVVAREGRITVLP
ncbi:MAG: type II toxin-antitoxin system VapC family toxin, partial [Steroidobacteraceae bacterium]